MSRTYNYNMAVCEAVLKEMTRDNKVVCLGQDFSTSGGPFGLTMGIAKKFPDRVFDTPICEYGEGYMTVGLALSGMRPIVDFNFSDFGTIASDSIINGAATYRFTSVGRNSVPATFLFMNGGAGTYGGMGFGTNHSQCMEMLYYNTPGLKIVAPEYPSDVHGLLRSAIQDNDPVIFMIHLGSTGGFREEVDFTEDDDYIIPLSNAAKVRREGTDVTIVAIQSMVPIAEKAAEELAKEGISVEIIDPRVLLPFDHVKVNASVKKTGKLLIVTEEHERGSIAGEIIKHVVCEDPSMLKKPAKVVGSLNAPIGSGYYEYLMVPHEEEIIAAVKELVK